MVQKKKQIVNHFFLIALAVVRPCLGTRKSLILFLAQVVKYAINLLLSFIYSYEDYRRILVKQEEHE